MAKNIDTLIKAGVIPPQHTLSEDDVETVNKLTDDEVDALIAVKSRLGDEFLKRNIVDAANCFL